MDQLTTRRLLLVKQLYLHAALQASRKLLSFRRIVAVITFDLAVETLIKVLIGFLDPKKTPRDDFQSMLNQLDSLFDDKGFGTVPQRGNILHVHSLRNDAQHKGKYPNEQDVEEAQAFVRAFLDETISQVWTRSLDSISVAESIRDEKVKDLIEQAEDALDAGDYSKVVRDSNAALTLSMDFARRKLFPTSRRRLYKPLGPVQWNIGPQASTPHLDDELRFLRSAFEDHGRQLERQIEIVRNDIDALRQETKNEFDVMEDLLILPLMGISHADFLEFRKLAGHVRFISIEESKFDVRGMKQDPEQSEAEFVLAFSSEAILEIQDRVADQM